MSNELTNYQHWDQCGNCGFQGLLNFRTREDENYAEQDALGFLLDCQCSSCGQETSVLMVVEEYQEMILLARKQL